ncbi:MAG: MATE family efflux transporter [Oscillospiraceae bacterium]|nr:MATE family efflux transporter [Oscillospiraceae bacterium]
MNILRKLFSVNHMIKSGAPHGALPTSGEAYRDLAKIAIPSVIEMVFMSIIGSVDMVMLRGLENPSAAIAAVGLAGQPRMITLTLFFALNIGVTAIVARRKGEERRDDANRTLRNAIVVILIMAGVVVLATLLLARPLLLLAGAQPDTIDMSHDYFRIMTYFLPVNALTMCLNAAQRGVGNTRTTMYVNLTANVVNVILDVFFIYGLTTKAGTVLIPAMGVAGDAWSTGIGFCVGLALCLFSLMRGRSGEKFLRLSFRESWRLHRDTVLPIIRIGGNAMIEQGAMRIGFFAYAAIVANLGTESFAAHQVGMQFLSISFTFGDGLGVAGTSLVGQMLGRGRPDLATIYGKCAQRIAVLVSLLLASCIVIFRYPLVGIFLDTAIPANVVPYSIAVNLMFMIALFQPFQMSSVIISGCLRGAGDNLHVAIVMIICVVGIRPLFSYLAVYVLGIDLVGAWAASLIDMSIRLTLMYRRFNSGKWQLKRV